MFSQHWLSLIQNSAVAQFFDVGRYLTMGVQIVHILSFTLLLAVVLALTLRVQGWSLRALPLKRFFFALQRPYRVALGAALAAGVLLFLPRALAYGIKEVFTLKLVLLALAIGTQVLLQRGVRGLGENAAATPALKSLALLSLLLWFGSAAAGRAIGFV
jgi:hypothetical protein